MKKLIEPVNMAVIAVVGSAAAILFFTSTPGWLSVTLFLMIAVGFLHLVTSD